MSEQDERVLVPVVAICPGCRVRLHIAIEWLVVRCGSCGLVSNTWRGHL